MPIKVNKIAFIMEKLLKNEIFYNSSNQLSFFQVPWSKYSKLKTTEEKAAYLNSLINDSIRKNK